MRFTIITIAATLLLVPATRASAAPAGVNKAQSTEFSAAKKKKAQKRKAEKVQYMRAVPAK